LLPLHKFKKMYTARTSRSSHEGSRTGSTRQVLRKNGELFGITHRDKALPLKEDRFAGESTYSNSFVRPVTAESLHSGRKSVEKPLVPFDLNAPRNVLPTKFPFDSPKARKTVRNASQFSLSDGSNAERTRFRTTSQISFINHPGGTLPVGFNNKGIMAEKTTWFHKRQLD